MPSASRVKPVVVKKNSGGSILDNVQSVEDLDTIYMRICIYGKNRVGKTTLGCQWPKPLLIVSFEPCESGGAASVRRMKDIDIIRPKSSMESFRLVEELKNGSKYKSLVIDTVTSFQGLILDEILGKPAPEQLDWGVVSRDDFRTRSSKTKEGLKPYMDLPLHVVMLAQEKDHNSSEKEKPEIIRSESIESFFAADLGGATVQWLHDSCDHIGRLSIDKEWRKWKEEIKLPGKNKDGSDKTKIMDREEPTGKIIRRLRTMYHPNYAAGFRAADPSKVPEFIDNPTFEKILEVIEGSK